MSKIPDGLEMRGMKRTLGEIQAFPWSKWDDCKMMIQEENPATNAQIGKSYARLNKKDTVNHRAVAESPCLD